MKRIFTSAFAFASLALVQPPVLQPVHAQSLQAAQNDVGRISAWLAEATPAIEEMYSITGPSEQAAIVVDQFADGAISAEDAKAQLAIFAEETRLITEAVKARLALLPPAPELEVIEVSSALNSDAFLDMADKISDVGLSAIEMLSKAVDGDVDGVEAGFIRSFEQTAVLVEVSNALVEADKASVSTKTHPQISVLDCLINSNELLLDALMIQGAFYEYPVDKTMTEAVSELRLGIRRHEKLVKEGKQYHATLTKNLSTAQKSATPGDSAILASALNAFTTYEQNWASEAQLIAAGKELIEVLRSDDAPYETIEAAIDEFFDMILFVEEERTRIIVDRIQMMQK